MTEFEATHKLRGSGYELRIENEVRFHEALSEYRDKHGNLIRLGDAAVEKVTLPEPADGTLWRDDSGRDYMYCAEERKFLSLLDTLNSDEIPVEVYESKDRRMTQMYLYENPYPAGRVLQGILDNFGKGNVPEIRIGWSDGKVRVTLTASHTYHTWRGTGETVERAVQDLNWNMIE